MQTITLKISGMHCTGCAMSIDGQLEDTDGVKEAKTNFAKQQTEVSFDSKKVTVDQMISIIRGIDKNYDAKVAAGQKDEKN